MRCLSSRSHQPGPHLGVRTERVGGRHGLHGQARLHGVLGLDGAEAAGRRHVGPVTPDTLPTEGRVRAVPNSYGGGRLGGRPRLAHRCRLHRLSVSVVDDDPARPGPPGPGPRHLGEGGAGGPGVPAGPRGRPGDLRSGQGGVARPGGCRF